MRQTLFGCCARAPSGHAAAALPLVRQDAPKHTISRLGLQVLSPYRPTDRGYNLPCDMAMVA